jgi:protein-disulfide isomerase
MRRYAPLIIVLVVAIITTTGGVVLYRSKLPKPLAKTTSAPETGSGEIHSVGSATAGLTLEEFGDFQCPPCGLLSAPLNQLVQEFQPHLRLVYRNFPLPVHLHAREAALAAEAAGLQGKFWEMHDLLYREQAVWSKATNVQFLFNTYANLIGIDAKRFAVDAASERTKELVEKDESRGKSLEVKNTPTLFLNGTAVDPKDLSPATLRGLVAAAVKKKIETSDKR